jgi:hypothetical protein
MFPEHILLNQTKINIKEIQQIWRAIKDITRLRMTVSQSALEIARKAGWDESLSEIEMRVKTAIAALEESGYIRRGQNMPKVFADSILCRNVQEAIERINASELFDDKEKENAIRIIKKLISSRSRSQAQDQEAESRVDYISDHLGIEKDKVIGVVNLLRQEGILADSKDLNAYIKKGENINRSMQIFESFSSIEKYMATIFEEQEATYHIKELNEEAEKIGCKNVTPNKIRMILNYWIIKKMIKYKNSEYSKNHVRLITLEPKEKFRERLEKRQELAKFVIEYLYSQSSHLKGEVEKEEVLVGFSVNELKKAYEENISLFKIEVSIVDIEDTLFYLSRIEAIKIEGGFLVVYNPMTIERLEEDTKRRYKTEDYLKLDQFYDNKVQQIHIVGEYAKKMVDNYRMALQFVEDYFRLNYTSFLQKYFKGSRGEEIRRNISPGKFKQLFGELSPTQLSIIKDNKNKNIAVLAGPGSGKTKVLVHKLASLILMEDVKHVQLLMLTYNNLLVPFIEDLYSAELIGSTCVLTHTNDEALQVTGLLLQKGISARLIQTNDGFNLYDLVEMRFFLEQLSIDCTSFMISDDIWNMAKRALVKRFGKSKMLDICKRIIQDFEAIFQKRKYITDFEVFIKESKLEDFYTESKENIYVSTIHKAKGKEFDNVFPFLENFEISTEEQKRQLYVAITRAKKNLTVHLNGHYLNHIQVKNLMRLEDRAQYALPGKLAMHLSHRDVWLDYFVGRQYVVENLHSGDILRYKNGEWLTDKGQSVLRTSKRFKDQFDRVQKNGYEPQFAKVNFIVFWRKEGEEQEIKIVLPKLYFERK